MIVSFTAGHLLERGWIPETQSGLLAAGGDAFAVGSKGDQSRDAPRPIHLMKRIARNHIPEAQLVAPGNQLLAIRRKRLSGNAKGVGLDSPQLFAGSGIPQMNLLLERAARQTFSIGGE